MKRRLAYLVLLLAAMFPAARPAAAQQIIVRRSQTTTTVTTGKPKDGDQKSSAATDDKAAAQPAILHWNNGESLPGELTGATNDSLVWRSPLFDDPLELSWSVLHRIDRSPADGAPADPFAFVLRDGSRIYGDLIGATAETIRVRSARHGEADLRRSEVVTAWRVRSEGVVYAGPWGESGWTPVQNIRLNQENTNSTDTLGKVPTHRTGMGGSLVLPFWRRTVANALTLPDRAEVDFSLVARDRPEFQLVLDGQEKKRLRIETWGSEVVLATAKGFTKVCDLADTDHRIALRVCWDRPGRRCQVYSPDGALLTDWPLPEGSEDGGKPSVLLANRGRGLTLDFLRIRKWDGQPPATVDTAHPRVELDDGRVLAGSIVGLDDGAVTVVPSHGEPPASVPLKDVDTVVFAAFPAWTTPHETTFSCADGTILHGQFSGFEGGRALLKTAFADTPLPVKIDDLRQMLIRPAETPEASAEPALDSLDKIVVAGTTLHGHLLATAGGTGPRWQPVGGKAASAPAATAVSVMTRVFPAGTDDPPADTLLYTRQGDALPGTLHSLDRTEVAFDSPWTETKILPAEELQAVQFNTTDKGAVTGFDAAGWQVLKGDRTAVRDKNNSVKLVPDTVVGHPGAAQDGDVRFTYDTERFSYLRVRLFCEGTNTSARALNYIVMRSGNRMVTGVETTEGQLNNQHQSPNVSGAVVVRFGIDEKSVRAYINDSLVETVWYPAAKRAGAGLWLESASVWGNQAQDIALSKFSASTPSGRSFLVNVNPEAKAQALTIPRFRKEDPPRHALLAANGDVLRGEIVALTNTQIGFRIGLETLHIPRDRVAALIALQPPTTTPPVADDADAMQKLMDRRVGLQTWYTNVSLASLLNVIQQSVPDLKFQPPGDADARRVQFRFENQSVGDLLDSLCEQFDLRYRVSHGTIVFENRDATPETALTHRAFWMKSNPFAARGSAAEQLAAKDVTFPKGSSVEWQESSHCLEVINTAANVEKIAGLLANDFGGTLGSPTHWLLLRNGGRIGLVVEKFEPDAVTGTHPVYGRCRVPFPDVYAVCNTLPEPTAATRAVTGWRAVYAQEPVVPESGGDASELLGKDAPTFKLKTLDGDEFDLRDERGKVVVLDFWATWCGPCIKSLPGLMDAAGKFPADKVKLIGVNQAEAPAQVKRFLETHQWNLKVALDAGQAVAKQYGVDGIPHTVIVGPDGKVAWVQTGYNPDGEEKAGEEIAKLLGGSGETPRANSGPAGDPPKTKEKKDWDPPE